jgi:hypothetical protein
LSAPVPAVLMVSNSVFFQAAKPQAARAHEQPICQSQTARHG